MGKPTDKAYIITTCVLPIVWKHDVTTAFGCLHFVLDSPRIRKIDNLSFGPRTPRSERARYSWHISKRNSIWVYRFLVVLRDAVSRSRSWTPRSRHNKSALSKSKSKVEYSSSQTPHRYGNSRAILGSHSITCYPAEVAFPPLPQPKLVLD